MIIRKINIQSRFRRKSGPKKRLSKGAIVLIVLLIILGYPTLRVFGHMQKLKKEAAQLKASFAANDIDAVNREIKEFSKEYTAFQKDARLLYWTSFIPYMADFKNGVEGGKYMVAAGTQAVEAITPYADLIGFKKGEVSFTQKSAEDRLQTAVLTLDKVLVRVDDISKNIEEAEKRISKINPRRYPKKLGKTQVRGSIENLKDGMLGVSTLFVDAKPLLKRLPEIMGKDEEKTYLILFQNDKERRATGGFLTSYAVFKVNEGKIKKESSDDIYRLDESIANHPVAPEKILKYHKNVSQFNIRDSNLSPDYVESLKLFNSLYEDSGRRVDYDGVIALDTKVLVDLLTIFGDTEAGGVVFSAKEDERCDCPQVIYTLFDIVDRPVNYIKEDRKGILGQLLEALLGKILGFSPSQYWGPFIANTFENMDTKHILVNFTDPDLQASIEKLNYGGRIREFDGDYLHINNVNFAGAKSNLFVEESIVSDTKIKGGKIEREVEITFKNPYPHSDCNLERGGLCLNAVLRNWMRVYVPKGSELVDFEGSQTKVLTYDELGKTVFEGFMTVSPKGLAKVKITYTLPDSVKEKDYKLYIQKQPGVTSQALTVDINGKTVFEGDLIQDDVFEQ